MRAQLTFRPDFAWPARGRLLVFTTSDDPEARTALAAALGVTEPAPAAASLAVPRHGKVVVETLKTLELGLDDAIPGLLRAAHDRGVPASVRTIGLATRLALTAVASHHVMPHLHPVADDAWGARDTHPPITGIWRIDLDADQALADAVDRLVETAPASATALASDEGRVADPRRLIVAYMDAAADALIRRHAPAPSGRPRDRLLPWTARWAEAVGDATDPTVPLRQEGPDLVAAVEGWQARTDDGAALALELTAPDQPAGPWHLGFAVCDTTGDRHDAAELWDEGDSALTETLLAGLSRAARVFPQLDAALGQQTPSGMSLTLDQAWQFIAEATPVLSGSGVEVTVPTTLDEDGLTAQVRLQSEEDGTVTATWEVSLDDRVLDDEEAARFAAADDELGFFGGRWVRIDQQARSALLARGHRRRVGRAEALAMALVGSTSDDWFGEGTAAGRVLVDDALAALVDAIERAGALEEVAETPDGFAGELRPYQRRGVAWLRGMADLGMGAVLADAMGLGKTVQLIGLLVSRPGPFIVVCPTSVVGNWERELNRFAPDLEVVRHHGPERRDQLDGFSGVLVTSYGTLRRDVDLLAGVRWEVVTLDEAQQVKNPATAAARAVRRLPARVVFALTGTPLENRLAELWAIMDATNRGLMGTIGSFNRRFALPVEVRHDADAASRLRRLVSPFVMRRTKDDPEVAKDLPDKIERTVLCSLTSEQAELYRRVTEESLARLAEADGIGRRGRILALLTALKQVTNHPAHYLGQQHPIVGRSGKLIALREIVEAVTDAGDAMLVFTQFTKMGDLLAAQLGEDLGTAVPFLHGGLTLDQRDVMVEEFQQGDGSPVLIVSTRAGGTGLNLTAATHVVHYDRWWNPAVEDQATDRTHRIGQYRTVEVHKLVTAGTLEERIAEMLDRKRALADAVVGSGESWITELDDDALAELVRLSVDAPLTDPLDVPAGAQDAATEETLGVAS